MNIYLQLGLGLLPGAVVATVLLVKRKAFQVQKIMISLLLLVLSGGLLFRGLSAFASELKHKPVLSQKKMTEFMNALIEEKAYPEAEEVIEEYSEAYGYDDECRLATARMALLQGEYDRAYPLYLYLSENTKLISKKSEELFLASEQMQDPLSDVIMVDYLTSQGKDITEYGYSKEQYETAKKALEKQDGKIEKKVEKAIQSSYSVSKTAKEYAEAVSEVSADYENIGEEETKSTAKYKKLFSEMEEKNKDYFSIDSINKARIKSYVMDGDFSELTENLKADSSYHESMIAAELYMGNLVGEKDFSDAFQSIDSRDAEQLTKQVNKIYRNIHEDMTVQERKALKARVEALDRQLEEPVLYTIKENLTKAAEEEAGTDATKVNLELAKIENYFGNEVSTDQYLREAIYSSQDNEDDSYVAAMSQIIGVIENDDEDESENIKNVSNYVDTVLDHSLTVDVEEIISSKADAVMPEQENTEDADTSVDSKKQKKTKKNSSDTEEEEENKKFSQAAVEYVSKAKTAISIGQINTEKFEEITAVVQIDSNYSDVKDLQKALKLYDCGTEITDFSIKKLDYTASNIILVCDVSGSMQGSIEDLRQSVLRFIQDKNKNENLSIVTFNDGIVDAASFGASDDKLIDLAESMKADGGTDMFHAVVDSLSNYGTKSTESNVLILMTDGQDNYPKTAEEIQKEIGKKAQQQGITIYTMGLGNEVDTAYLSTIASSGNGKFVYVYDSSSLSSFYDMLHAKVYSQYEVKYKAEDTLTLSGRTLEITLPAENSRDVKTYSLEGAADSENALGAMQDVRIDGVFPRFVYKGLQDTTVRLKGEGFQEKDKISVKLNGNIDYTLTTKYIDKETYEMTVPAGIAVGSYNVEVSFNGKKKVIQKGFSVIADGDQKKTVFGPYVFTSAEKIENAENDYTLSGAVTLNGWLHFKGDIHLQGDLENDGSISVSDYDGSYIQYDVSGSEGVAKYMAEKGIAIQFPRLEDFRLYNDPQNIYDYEKYKVDDISTGLMEVVNLTKFDKVTMRLYPNSIGLYYQTGSTILPYQKQILKAARNLELFKFSAERDAIFTNKKIGILIDFDYEGVKSDYNTQLNLLNSPVYCNGNFKAHIDTIKNEYTLGGLIRLAFFANQSGLGAEISWKDNLVPNYVQLSLELPEPVILPTVIPVEVNDFAFKVSDIDKAAEKGAWLSLKFTGKASLSTLKIKEYIPELEPFLGDLSLLEMPKTEATLRVAPITFEAKAKLNFLSEIQLVDAEIHLGTFDYSNSLLALDDVEVKGLSAKVKAGFFWETADKRISIDSTGTGELDAHTRFAGLYYVGTTKYDISWWVLHYDQYESGEFALGLYLTHDGKKQFIFTKRNQDSDGKVRGEFYYIDENGRIGNRNGTLT